MNEFPVFLDGRGPAVAVLGASGFIGRAVLGELARRPVRLRAVARSAVAAPARTVHRADLLDPGAIAAAVDGADVLVHLVAHAAAGSTWRSAATDPAAERVNVGLVADLVDALRARPRASPPVLLYAGSAQAAHRGAAGRYARQKIRAEEILGRAAADGLLRAVVLRLPTVYGPAGRGFVAAMARRAIAGERLTLWNDGSVRRNLLHVDDVAGAFGAALDHRGALGGGTWAVGADEAVPLAEVFTAIALQVSRETGRAPVPVTPVPAPDAAEANDLRSDDIDSSDFRARTGWRPAVALPDGIRRTVSALVTAEKTTSGEQPCGYC